MTMLCYWVRVLDFILILYNLIPYNSMLGWRGENCLDGYQQISFYKLTDQIGQMKSKVQVITFDFWSSITSNGSRILVRTGWQARSIDFQQVSKLAKLFYVVHNVINVVNVINNLVNNVVNTFKMSFEKKDISACLQCKILRILMGFFR